MDDHEQRLKTLEVIVFRLTTLASVQADEINRLRLELDDLLTDQALATLTPWPTRVPR
jgi:hypothetical protein